MRDSLLTPCPTFLGGDMPASTNQIAPEELTKDILWHRRLNVAQQAAAARRHFAPLTMEEKTTYRKWRRATLVFYATFAFVIAALLIAIGPPDASTNANGNDSYSALGSPRTPQLR
jgi:hypothetical protein